MKYTGTLALVLCLLVIGYLIYDKTSGQNLKRVGYVDMDKLVSDYKGMKEATQRYEKKVKAWTQESDSLKQEVMRVYEQLRRDSLANHIAGIKTNVKRFLYLRERYMKYAQDLEAKAGEADNSMTGAVLNQINEHLKTYAEQNGFDVVLCNTSSSYNVGYAKAHIDITAKVLTFANIAYEGGKN